MTTTERESTPARRRRPIEVRRAAARLVVAANTANGKKTDPRIVAIAEGKQS
ncbi:hypothetical protein ACAG26_06765 [Mycobacterium sp. pUA109]|uniref:hypothetical protein n=1 Tax=Mycobacterium sp. pUA109 TaxID=3238982 RepID=UPI00351B98D3